MVRIGLVADDLTGACDSALPFLAGGRVLVGLWPDMPLPPCGGGGRRPEGGACTAWPDQLDGLACAAVSTESRAEPPSVSFERSRTAGGWLGARCDLVYRKLDSMLRGNPVADLAGVLDAAGGSCLVAPALPGEGRLTAGGVQRWPGGSADLGSLLAPLAGRVAVRDAASDGELDAVAREALDRGDRVLAGTAGLAAALARALGLGPPPAAPRPGCVRPLAVVGSPAAGRQAGVAASLGDEVRLLGPGELPDLDGHDGLVLTGGETAARVLRRCGASGLELLGEALPRAPLARVRGGRLDGLPVVLKAGAFGAGDAVHRALEALRAGE